MLEKLNDKFIDERTDIEKQEMNSKHASDMLMQDLSAQIAQATKDRDEKAESKAKTLQAKADANGDLKDTTNTRNEDSKYLAELTATCAQKASDFESRQQLRADYVASHGKCSVYRLVSCVLSVIQCLASCHLVSFSVLECHSM